LKRDIERIGPNKEGDRKLAQQHGWPAITTLRTKIWLEERACRSVAPPAVDWNGSAQIRNAERTAQATAAKASQAQQLQLGTIIIGSTHTTPSALRTSGA
jgi:hypothetical protein